jgi:hypothetical protein
VDDVGVCPPLRHASLSEGCVLFWTLADHNRRTEIGPNHEG